MQFYVASKLLDQPYLNPTCGRTGPQLRQTLTETRNLSFHSWIVTSLLTFDNEGDESGLALAKKVKTWLLSNQIGGLISK